MVEVPPHIINVILPEQRSHFLQQLGYILATLLLLALIVLAVVLLTRQRKIQGFSVLFIGPFHLFFLLFIALNMHVVIFQLYILFKCLCCTSEVSFSHIVIYNMTVIYDICMLKYDVFCT